MKRMGPVKGSEIYSLRTTRTANKPPTVTLKPVTLRKKDVFISVSISSFLVSSGRPLRASGNESLLPGSSQQRVLHKHAATGLSTGNCHSLALQPSFHLFANKGSIALFSGSIPPFNLLNAFFAFSFFLLYLRQSKMGRNTCQ